MLTELDSVTLFAFYMRPHFKHALLHLFPEAKTVDGAMAGLFTMVENHYEGTRTDLIRDEDEEGSSC